MLVAFICAVCVFSVVLPAILHYSEASVEIRDPAYITDKMTDTHNVRKRS